MTDKQRIKTILLTGATGFLGSSLLPRLIELGYEMILLKRSLSDVARIKGYLSRVKMYDIDQVDMRGCFTENQVDLIVHCATNYGRKNVDPLQIIESNLILPLTLLETGASHGLQGFINTDTILDKRINSYSLSKKQFLDWLKAYSERTKCVNVALEHFYGPGDDRTKFISFVVNQLLGNVPAIDLTAGEQKRDFIYIEDVVAAFIIIINNLGNMRQGFSQYEIGTDNLIRLRDSVTLIKELVGNKVTSLNFGALPYRTNEVMAPRVDTAAIRQLGWQPQINLTAGLSMMIEKEKELRNK